MKNLLKSIFVFCLIFVSLNICSNAQSIDVLEEEQGFGNLKLSSSLTDVLDDFDMSYNDTSILNSIFGFKVLVLKENKLGIYNHSKWQITTMILYFHNDTLFEIMLDLNNPKESYFCSLDKYGDDEEYFYTASLDLNKTNFEYFIWESKNIIFKLEKNIYMNFPETKNQYPSALPMFSTLRIVDKNREEKFTVALYKNFFKEKIEQTHFSNTNNVSEN